MLLAAGLAYAWFCTATGLAIPCPFRLATGLQCPGCGVTRMCLALLRLDLAGAWRYNPGLLAISPLLALLVLRVALRYVRSGDSMPRGWERPLLWALVAWLLIWGVLRNLVR